MSVQVAPPIRTPYRYGLLFTGQVVEHGDSLRLYSDYQFDSVACHQGLTWDINCAPSFAVTFTRTAVADTFSVTVTPGVVGDYEYNVNGGAFATLTASVVIAAAPPVTVVVREIAGLQRSVTLTNVNPDAPTGTVFVFQSAQTNNVPKSVEEGINNQTATPFVVINGVSCTLIATPDIEQKALEAFQSDEQRLVEQHFWTQLSQSSPALPLGAAAVPLNTAIAGLEEYVRQQTGYTGMLHSSPFVGPYASSNSLIPTVHPEPSYKRTALWTPWVFGGGYTRTGPIGQPAPAVDQAWIYVTGQVVIHRGAITPFGGPEGGFNVSTNQDYAIVERSYVVINDCPVAAVLADVDA